MKIASQKFSEPAILKARLVFPVEGPPREGAGVEIASGRIAALHDHPPAKALDLGNVALIPGLVNAHTHLELSDVSSPLAPARPFTAWLQSVIDHRRKRQGDSMANARAAGLAAILAGRAESLAAGTTLLGDIVSADLEDVADGGARVISFRECLGLSQTRIAEQVAAARAFLDATNSTEKRRAGQFQPGLSPHAPYSVHPNLLRSLVDLAVAARVPLAMHLAETPEERTLLETGGGPFAEFLKRLEVWRDDVFGTGWRTIDCLRELSRAQRGLVVHGNDLTPEEIEFLADCQSLSVVYCPRTHAHFGHAPHPWTPLLSRGVCVALGTDSRASNPDLNLWHELRFLHDRFPQVPPAQLLALATLNGAKALGLAAECGTISVGKRADLTVVALSESASADPYELLFNRQSQPIGTLVGGAHETN